MKWLACYGSTNYFQISTPLSTAYQLWEKNQWFDCFIPSQYYTPNQRHPNLRAALKLNILGNDIVLSHLKLVWARTWFVWCGMKWQSSDSINVSHEAGFGD